MTSDDGITWVEVHRPDLPWGRSPSEGSDWTTDDEMRTLLGRLALDVD